jgi:hypothetical protein
VAVGGVGMLVLMFTEVGSAGVEGGVVADGSWDVGGSFETK